MHFYVSSIWTCFRKVHIAVLNFLNTTDKKMCCNSKHLLLHENCWSVKAGSLSCCCQWAIEITNWYLYLRKRWRVYCSDFMQREQFIWQTIPWLIWSMNWNLAFRHGLQYDHRMSSSQVLVTVLRYILLFEACEGGVVLPRWTYFVFAGSKSASKKRVIFCQKVHNQRLEVNWPRGQCRSIHSHCVFRRSQC